MHVITRFAPSPTGLLHLGHAFAAWFARQRARAAGGRFLLRLEDIDSARCQPEFARGVMQDLSWLGLTWEGEVRVQSEHAGQYEAALAALRDRGLLYPCFCSRADIRQAATAPHGPHASVYPGTCRDLGAAERAARLAAGTPHAWRLHSARAAASAGPLTYLEEGKGRVACDPQLFGDVVLGRRDGPVSYHLAVTHDDAWQGVTLVTRGNDLAAATPVHRLLQAVMGWPEPTYAHHRLLVDAAGRRLSKRDGATAVHALRDSGASPEQVLALARSGCL